MPGSPEGKTGKVAALGVGVGVAKDFVVRTSVKGLARSPAFERNR